MDLPEFGPSAVAARTPDKLAFVEDGLTTSYVDFDARTDLVARGLAARRLGADDRIALMLQNSVAFFEFLQEEMPAMLARWRARGS